MQFQGKSMIQTRENDKKPHFVPDLGLLGRNSCRQNAFSKICFCQSLDIMVTYHHVKYQEKTDDLFLRKFSKGWTDGRD